MQVAREDVDGFVFCAFTQFAEQVGFQVGVELDLPGPAHHFTQPFVSSAATGADAEAFADHAFARVHAAGQLITDLQAGAQDAFVTATEDRQGAVRGRAFEFLVVLEIIAELGPFVFFAGDDAGAEDGVVFEVAAQAGQQVGVLGEALHKDVFGPFEHGLDVGKAFFDVDKALGFAFRRQRWVVEQCVGQFAEAGFQGNLALGAAFLFKRQVQIFQAGFGLRQVDFAGQFGRQLALFFNAGEDAGAALVEFAQVAQALFQVTQLRVVEAAGDLFAVARNKRHGGAFIEQRHGGGDLLRAHAQFIGDAVVDAIHINATHTETTGRPRRPRARHERRAL